MNLPKTPIIFKNVKLPESDEGKRKIIERYNKKLALVQDFHYEGLLVCGHLQYLPKDKERYSIHGLKGEERLSYNDLETLSISLKF